VAAPRFGKEGGLTGFWLFGRIDGFKAFPFYVIGRTRRDWSFHGGEDAGAVDTGHEVMVVSERALRGVGALLHNWKAGGFSHGAGDFGNSGRGVLAPMVFFQIGDAQVFWLA